MNRNLLNLVLFCIVPLIDIVFKGGKQIKNILKNMCGRRKKGKYVHISALLKLEGALQSMASR